LEAFKTIIKLDDIHIIRMVIAKHRAFIDSKYQEWSIKGLGKWF